MDIAYDPEKRETTLRERGVDFEDAAEVFAGDTSDIPDNRRAYPEPRTNSVGHLHGRMVIITWSVISGTHSPFRVGRSRARLADGNSDLTLLVRTAAGVAVRWTTDASR